MRLPRFQFKLLLYGLLLGTISVVSTGLLSYHISSREIHEKVNQGNAHILLQTQMRVEQILTSIDHATTQFITSPLVNDSLRDKLDNNDFVKVNDLKMNFQRLQLNKYSIKQSYLINFHQDWIIDDYGRTTYRARTELHDTVMRLARLPKSSAWVLEQFPEIDNSNERSDRIYVTLAKKIPLLSVSPAPQGLVILNIEFEEFSKLLAQQSGLGRIYLFDSKLNRIAPRDDDVIADLVQNNSALLEQNQSGYMVTHLQEKKIGIHYRKSAYNGWLFVSVTSIHDIVADSRKIGWITFYFCVALVVLVAAGALFGARHMYAPIGRLFETVMGAGVSPLDRHMTNELHVIENHVKAIVRSQGKLREQMNRQTVQLRELFVLKLLQRQLSHEEVLDRFIYFGFPLEWKSLYVIVIKIQHLKETRYREEDRELMMFAINNIVNDLIHPDTRLTPVLLHDTQVTVVLFSEEDNASVIARLSQYEELIRDSVQQYLQIPIRIGISGEVQDVQLVPMAYQEGLRMVQDSEEDEPNRYHEIVQESGRDNGFNQQIVEVLRIIQEEFDLDLTLDSCADRLGIHPSHLSRKFKRETGKTFSEYLAHYRLGHAKQWLRDTDMKISDIADKLRYNSSAAFIRSFRRMEGKTPGQFREDADK